MSKYKAPLKDMLTLIQEDVDKLEQARLYVRHNDIIQKALTCYQNILDKVVARDELGEYYLCGFTATEVLSGYDGKITKQGLYSKAEKLDEHYREVHVANREDMQGELEHYFFYERPNMTGTMDVVREVCEGKGYSKVYEEYVMNGGLAPKYDEQMESDSVYKPYYEQLANNQRPEGVTDTQYKTMLAGFYRYRKGCVDKAIILGDLEDIAWLKPTQGYIEKRREVVYNKVIGYFEEYQLDELENNGHDANVLVYIEMKMGVYGLQARYYYKDVIESLGYSEDDYEFAVALLGNIIIK